MKEHLGRFDREIPPIEPEDVLVRQGVIPAGDLRPAPDGFHVDAFIPGDRVGHRGRRPGKRLERLPPLPQIGCSEGRHSRRVEPPAQVRPHRLRRAQAARDRLLQELAKPFGIGFVRGHPDVRHLLRRPIPVEPRLILRDDQPVGRGELHHTVVKCVSRFGVVRHLLKRGSEQRLVEDGRDGGIGKHSLDVGGKDEKPWRVHIEKRSKPDMVSTTDKGVGPGIPDNKGKRPDELLDAGRPPSLVCPDDQKAIGQRCAHPFRHTQPVQQFSAVVDAGIRRDGEFSAGRKRDGLTFPA